MVVTLCLLIYDVHFSIILSIQLILSELKFRQSVSKIIITLLRVFESDLYELL